jgi:hypothetical protein
MRTTSCTDHCSTRMMLLDLACQNRGKPLGLELRLPLVEIEEEGARVTPADDIIEPDPPWRLAPVSARRPRGRVGRNTGKDSQSPLNPTPRPASKEQRAKSKEQRAKRQGAQARPAARGPRIALARLGVARASSRPGHTSNRLVRGHEADAGRLGLADKLTVWPPGSSGSSALRRAKQAQPCADEGGCHRP